MEYRELMYIVTEDGMTAGKIMRDKMHLSGREVSRCKQFEEGVMISESERGIKPARLIDKLQKGQVLIVRLYEDTENAGDIVPIDGEIDIVYEDEDLIVLNKPGDMVVHPSYAHYTDSLSNFLAGYYKRTGQNHVIRTVGRLDRETSGLVMFAKNRHAAALLGGQKDNMSKRKEYLALCHGIFENAEETIDAPIRRKPGDRMIREIHPDGKEAVTHYHVERQLEDYALVRLHLDTGRTHQIRVHMSCIGHPLLGDNFYGREESDSKNNLQKDSLRKKADRCGHGLTRAALHAGKLEFIHPITNDVIKLVAELPEDISKLLI